MCGDCHHVRQTSFGSRVYWLLQPRYCFGCHAEHPGTWFASSYRVHTSQYQKCILWYGRISICPHLSITWEEFQEMKDKEFPKNIFTKACSSTECKDYPRIKISNHDNILEFGIGWTHYFPKMDMDASTFTLQAFKVLRAKYRYYNKAFCQNVQGDPFKLDRPDLIQSQDSEGEVNYIHCNGCTLRIVLCRNPRTVSNPTPPAPHIRLTKAIRWYRDKPNPIPLEAFWAIQMDLDSTGLWRDPAFKNITWCDDITCSTTKELGLHTTFITGSQLMLEKSEKLSYRAFKTWLMQILDKDTGRKRYTDQDKSEVGRRENLWEARRMRFQGPDSRR